MQGRQYHILSILFLLFLLPVILVGQHNFESWYQQGSKSDFPTGIRSVEWYASAPKASSKKIIVAILDSGVDITHPDLEKNIWVNPHEIPSNGIDDDLNGYVDDIHGWNFIGGSDGQNVINESLEVTRVYARERALWEGIDPEKLKGKKKKAYAAYLERKELVETKRSSAKQQLEEANLTSMIVIDALKAAKKALEGDTLNLAKLESSDNEDVQIAARIIENIREQGIEIESIDWLIDAATEEFEAMIEPSEEILKYRYNPDYDSREIVGDDYFNFEDRFYGNNMVGETDGRHGTHVAGIVGAVRNNDLGMDGIADHVSIMCVRVVPDGDERDKDVANGIRYAVDNGALVINMSFGKGYSPEKEWVDDAMKYAAKHDVLLVMSAGNSAQNIDEETTFPTDTYKKKPLFGKKRAKNCLSIGALSPDGGEAAVAEFSNYGKKEVDIFAPGVYIYSTVPGGTYDYLSGTSMASPVVSGVAALIRSRYPSLSAIQVKDIIMKSCRKLEGELTQPGTFTKVPASAISATGGMVDVVEAMKLAAKTKGKARLKKRNEKAEMVTPQERT